LPWRQAVPYYWLNVVNFHSLTFRKTLALLQSVTMIVIVVSAAACVSKTAGYNTNRKRTTEGAVCRNHVVLAQILGHCPQSRLIRTRRSTLANHKRRAAPQCAERAPKVISVRQQRSPGAVADVRCHPCA
jgi:hypothetical protein